MPSGVWLEFFNSKQSEFENRIHRCDGFLQRATHRHRPERGRDLISRCCRQLKVMNAGMAGSDPRCVWADQYVQGRVSAQPDAEFAQ